MLILKLRFLINSKLEKFVKKEEGATAVEYALIVGGIAIVLISAIIFFGEALNDTFRKVGCDIQNKTYDASANECVGD